MRVRLTREALAALGDTQERLQQGSPVRQIVCLVWAWHSSRPGADGKFHDHGPGLHVGAFDAASDPSGYQRLEQDGLEYLLALPKEAHNDGDPTPQNEAALIDVHRGKFFFL